MKYTSDGSALAMAWKRGGFAIWSVFGSLLLQSIGNQFGLDCLIIVFVVIISALEVNE